MNKGIKNFIKAAKRDRLSERERSLVRSKISEFISFNPIRGAMPHLAERSYLSIFEVRAFAKAAAFVLIIAVVAGGSGVSYAAQNSLPGQTLYTIKVNVNEAVESGFARTPEARVALQSKHVERRLEEAQTLAKTDKLSKETEQIVIKKIADHIADLEKEIDTLKEKGRVDVVLETTAKLAPVMEAHKEILEKNASESETDASDEGDLLLAKVEDGIKAVEDEETLALAEAAPTEPDPAAATMAMSLAKAENIQSDLKRDARETITDIEDKIEDLVESRIDSAEEKIAMLRKEHEKTEIVIEQPVVADKSIETTAVPTTPAPVETNIVEPVLPAVDEDALYIETRLAAAEDTLKRAKEAFRKESWNEALGLAQEANRIAVEIETFIHLHELDLAKAQVNTPMKASAVEPTKQ